MQNVLTKAVFAKLKWRSFFVVAGFIVVGAIIGFGFAELWPGYASAISRVEVGQIEMCAGRADSCQTKPVQDVAAIAEFLGSPQATRSIAEQLGRPDLAASLTEARFGGLGNLKVRESPRFPIVQIRVKAKTEAIALAAVEAATKLLLEEHKRKTAELNGDFKNVVNEERANYDNILRTYNEIINNAEQQLTAKDSSMLAQLMLLIIISNDLHKSLDEARAAYDTARRQMDQAALLSTEVVLPPTVEFSILAVPSRVAALGAVIGLLVGALIATLGAASNRMNGGPSEAETV